MLILFWFDIIYDDFLSMYVDVMLIYVDRVDSALICDDLCWCFRWFILILCWIMLMYVDFALIYDNLC